MLCVSQLQNEYKCIHAITTYGGVDNDTIDISLPDKFAYTIINTYKSISCSVFQVGLDNQTNMYGCQGIILKTGEITSINDFDAGTSYDSKIGRIPNHGNIVINLADIKTKTQNRIGKFNEILVNHYSVEGIYFTPLSIKTVFGTEKEFFECVKEIPLPVYFLMNSQFYIASYDQITQRFIISIDELK